MLLGSGEVAALTLEPLLEPARSCGPESLRLLLSDDSSEPRRVSGGGSDWRELRWLRRRDESRRPQKRAMSEPLLVESMVDSRRLRILVEADVDDESVERPHGRLRARSASVSRRGSSLVLRRRVDPEPMSLLPRPTPTPLPHSRKMSVSCASDDLAK